MIAVTYFDKKPQSQILDMMLNPILSMESVGITVQKMISIKEAWGSATLLKRDPNTVVFLWNLQNF